MDLDDVVYIIEGKLVIEQVPGTEGPLYTAILYDNTGDICVVLREGKRTKKVEAKSAPWYTLEGACGELAGILGGNILQYDFPLMWTTHTESIRIPPTLIGKTTVTSILQDPSATLVT